MTQEPSRPPADIPLSGALPASQLAAFTVQGKPPSRAAAPRTPAVFGELLRSAARSEWAVIPFGSGSHQDSGNPPQRFDLALSTALLDRIPEYEPQDLVVRVESGCRLVRLQKLLAAERLYLPIDPPGYQETTLGGMVATNASGPDRFGQGTLRDYLLGIGVIQPDGSQTRFGSRVVKNVTGYDMCKLYTGSHGTLGIFSDFYFKLKPLPPLEKTVLVLFEKLSKIQEAMRVLLRSPLQPGAIEFLNDSALGRVDQEMNLSREGQRYALVVKFGDLEKTVNWQVKQLEGMWKPHCDRGIVVGDPGEQAVLWELLREDHFYLAKPPLKSVKLKMNLLPNRLVQWVEVVERQLSAREAPVYLKAHAGSGILRIFYPYDPSRPEGEMLAKLIEEWREGLRPVRGSVVIESGPASLKSQIDAWGYRYKDLDLMRQIKNRLDPHGLLNPGRFVV